MDNNINKNINGDIRRKKEEEERKNLQSSSVQPRNEKSDTNIGKMNGERTVETTPTNHQKEESGFKPVSSNTNTNNNIKAEEIKPTIVSSNPNNDKDSKNDGSTTLSTTPNDKKKDESKSSSQDSTSNSNPNDTTFTIEKGRGRNLTDFQRQKANYFFNINLDIENKEYVTWEDVEFYLLFHGTAAGKEGTDSDNLEARLNRAAKAFWDHVHDQVPLADNKRDILTLNQFLDTWASLIDYVVRTNQLPSVVQELAKLGFELYATDNDDTNSATIEPNAFDQLFQKMNLSRPYAMMAYRYLTENGLKPLDAERIDSLVKAVITSSDDEHDSHFLLPGFFKTITHNKNNQNSGKSRSPSPTQNKEEPQSNDTSSRTSTGNNPQTSTSIPSSQPQQQQQQNQPSPSQFQQQQGPSSIPPQQQQNQYNPSAPQFQQQQGSSKIPPQQQNQYNPSSSPSRPQSGPSSIPSQQQNQYNSPLFQSLRQSQHGPTSIPSPQFNQYNPSSSQPQQQQSPSKISPQQQQQQQQKPNNPQLSQNQPPFTFQHGITPSPRSNLSPNQQQNIPPPSKQQPLTTDQEDEGIRRLLRFYHIDDADIVEVSAGSPHRLVVVHPERPLPPYLQQNPNLLQRPQPGSTNVSPNQLYNDGKLPSQKSPITSTGTYPRTTLDQRMSRGEAQRGPTIPFYQEQQQGRPPFTGVNQVYPPLSKAQQEEQQRQAKLQANQPDNNTKKGETKEKKDVTPVDEKKIVDAVVRQLTPIVQKQVAEEIRRTQSGQTDEDDDDDFIPFPLMLAGGFPFFAASGGGPPRQQSKRQQQEPSQENSTDQTQGQSTGPREADFGELPNASFFPPPLFMAMMNDLARATMGQEMSGFPPNMPPHRGPGGVPIGVEGFMIFDDDNGIMGGPPGYPPQSDPRL